jgi:hypothetical protein
MRAHFLPHLALLLVLPTYACTTRTALVNLWVDPEHPSQSMKQVLVVALWRDPDARAMWEERFAQELEDNDIKAMPSYVSLTSPLPDSVAVFREARNRSCDGVVVIHEHVLETSSFYIPGLSVPEATKTRRWHRSSGKREVWMDGGAAPGSIAALRCDVEMWSPFDNNSLVWSGTSEVVDADSNDHAADRVADSVVDELARVGLVSATF